MKQIVFIVLILTLCTSCSGNRKKILETKQETDTTKTVQLDWSEGSFLKPYMDSLNIFKEGDDFPEFLKDDCFDYVNKFYWKPKHNPKSFRRQLIYSVNDSKTLLLLLKNEDKISGKVCTEKLEHPYGGDPSDMDSQQLTNLQLIMIRLKELEK